MFQIIEKSISEVTNASVNRCKFNLVITSWDGSIIQEWKSIFIPFGTGTSSNLQTPTYRSTVKWQPPMPGFVKLNFDGASRGNPGQSGLGACIRDCIGKVLEISMAPVPIGTNNMAKAQSLL